MPELEQNNNAEATASEGESGYSSIHGASQTLGGALGEEALYRKKNKEAIKKIKEEKKKAKEAKRKAKKAKKKAKGLKTKTKNSGTSDPGITALLGAVFAVIILIILICMLPLFAVGSLFSGGTWTSEGSDKSIAEMTNMALFNNTQNTLRASYLKAQNQVASNIEDYIKEKYPACDRVDVAFLAYGAGTFGYENNSTVCKVTVSFDPDIYGAVNYVNAYASGVNGSIIALIDDTSKLEDDYNEDSESENQEIDADKIVDFVNSDDDGRQEKYDEEKKELDDADNEYYSVYSKKHQEVLAEYSDNFFHPDTESENWSTSYTLTKEESSAPEEVSCKTLDMASTLYQQHCASNPTGTFETEVYHSKDVYDIEIRVPMNYSFTEFKKDKLDKAINLFAEENDLSYDDAKAEYFDPLIRQYTDSFLEINAYWGQEGSGEYSAYSGAAEGVDPIFFQTGEQGWEGHFTNYAIKNLEEYFNSHGQNATWNLIEEGPYISAGYNSSLGSWRQCVLFSKGWIYYAYGESYNSLGNGQNVVSTLVSNGWTLLDTPAPGAVFSSSAYGTAGCDVKNISTCNPYGHTGVILAVENDTVTYMDGNASGQHGIRIKTISYDSFMNGKMGSPYIKFAVKK